MRTLLTFTSLVLLVVGCTSAAGDGEELGSSTLNTESSSARSGDDGDDGDDAELVAADDDATPDAGATPGELSISQTMRTTANLNLRRGATTTYAVVAVIPEGSVVTIVDPTPVNNFLRIDWNGTIGWSSASYLVKADGAIPAGDVDVNGPPSRDNTIARAQAAMGFSYWWGHGAWLDTGPTASTKGACRKLSSSGCPNCTHSGKYGADCSGLVAKAWQYGAKPLDVDSHPYGTVHLNKDSSRWTTIPKSALIRGDALVYNTASGGHTMIWDRKDGAGAHLVYECKGCNEGCVHDARNSISAYKAIRRTGF